MVERFDGQSADLLNESLDSFVEEAINCKVNIDLVQGGFTLPLVMQSYRSDFGGTDKALLTFVYSYLKDEHEEVDLHCALK